MSCFSLQALNETEYKSVRRCKKCYLILVPKSQNFFEKSYFQDEMKFVLQDDFRPFFVYRKVFEQHKVCGYNKVLIYYFQTIFQ